MLGKKKKVQEKEQHSVVLYDLPGNQGAEMISGAAIKGNQVSIFRPPVLLSPDGKTMPGVSRELVARYLVSMTSALADSQLGPVTVEWVIQEGRFCKTAFHIPTWGTTINMVHPIAPISQALANVWEVYRGGMALKARELHKGHQQFADANATIEHSIQMIERLRDDSRPHFTDAEYLFLQAEFAEAKVLSALLPYDQESDPQAAQLVGEHESIG